MEKTRSEFETAFAKKHNIPLKWVQDGRDGESYLRDPLEMAEAWYFWKASREALKVDMPPILPCLCANSDIVDGNHQGQLSYRGDVINTLFHSGITVEV